MAFAFPPVQRVIQGIQVSNEEDTNIAPAFDADDICRGLAQDVQILNEEATNIVPIHDADDIRSGPPPTFSKVSEGQVWGQNVKNSSPILNLPNDLLFRIFTFTSLRDRSSCCYTCKSFHCLNNTPGVLKAQIFNLYPHVSEPHRMDLYPRHLAEVNRKTGLDWSAYSPKVHFFLARYLNLIRVPEHEFRSLKKYDGDPDRVNSLAWSPDGQHLAAAGMNGRCYIWNLNQAEGEELIYTELNSYDLNIMTVSWHLSGQRLAIGLSNGYIKIIEPLTDQQDTYSFKAHNDVVTGVSWCPGGSYLASCSLDKVINIWQENTMEISALPFRTKRNEEATRCIDWSYDGRRLASGSDNGDVHILEPANPEQKQFVLSLGEEKEAVTQVAWNRASHLAACAGRSGIRVWNVSQEGGSVICDIDINESAIVDLSWNWYGFLASCSASCNIKIWDLEQKKERRGIAEIKTGVVVNSLAWHPDGQYLATGSRDGESAIRCDPQLCSFC